MYELGEKENNQFFMAASLIMKSFTFGLLADLFGDCPYSEALQAGNDLLFLNSMHKRIFMKEF